MAIDFSPPEFLSSTKANQEAVFQSSSCQENGSITIEGVSRSKDGESMTISGEQSSVAKGAETVSKDADSGAPRNWRKRISMLQKESLLLFAFLYILNLAIILLIYVKTDVVPSWALC